MRDEVLAKISPKIIFVIVPPTCAPVKASFIPLSESKAESAICMPLFTASATLLVVVFEPLTPTVTPVLSVSITSVYLVVSISLASIVKSPPVVKSAPPISVVPFDLILRLPPVVTFPSVHVVLFSLELFTDTPTVV